MHYKNGREVKLGDICTGISYQERIIGVITNAYPGATACNAIVTYNLSVLRLGGPALIGSDKCTSITTNEWLHIEDYIASLTPVQVVEGEKIPTIGG